MSALDILFGPAVKLMDTDIARAAAQLNVDPPTIQAVIEVETGGLGGFLSDGSMRPRILFEAHIFARETGGQFNTSHPEISSPTWNRSLYRGGAREYDRIEAAATLNRDAALKSASWGMFQILAKNHLAGGYNNADAFVRGQCLGEPTQLATFLSFVRNAGLTGALQEISTDPETCRPFCAGYNGSAYRENNYHVKIAAAVAKHRGVQAVAQASAMLRSGERDEAVKRLQEVAQAAASASGLLRIGDRGEAVKRLQAALQAAGWPHVAADGAFGRVTEIALEQFQQRAGLVVDGVAGPLTRGALGL